MLGVDGQRSRGRDGARCRIGMGQHEARQTIGQRCLADAFRASGDQDRFARELQIHGFVAFRCCFRGVFGPTRGTHRRKQ